MRSCVITAAVRTPVGAYLGGLKTVCTRELAAPVLKEVLVRSNIEASQVDEVILGEVLGVSNIARGASLEAGYPIEVPAYRVDRQCASSLQAVINATQQISVGMSDIIVAGGVEAMSSAFYVLPPSSRYEGFRINHSRIHDIFFWAAENAQPPHMYPGLNMGITAENVAKKHNITREEQDAFAYDSQMKTKAAVEAGLFKDEILPVEVTVRKKSFVVDADEHPKPETTMESLAKLRPSFIKDGTVTAGNSSGMNDGASAVVVMSEDKAKELGIKPLVRVVGYADAGVGPDVMGLGPVPAVGKLLKQTGLTLNDIDLFELNEAFAAQSLGCLKELGMLPGTELYNRVNVNGGAIAHGHALGNTGTRILSTLIYELKRRNKRYGLETLCIGGGQGLAMIVENVM